MSEGHLLRPLSQFLSIGLDQKPARVLLLGAAFYLTTLLVFYPPVFAIFDEAGYFGQAKIFAAGHVFQPLRFPTGVETAHGFVTKYPPGMSLLLSPLVGLHWRLGFLLNPLLHLLAFAVLARFLKSRNANPAWALLYLFHPGFVLYTRTLMSDVAAASLLLIAACTLEMSRTRGRGLAWLAGLAGGLAGLIRLPCFLLAGVLAVYAPSAANQRRWFLGPLCAAAAVTLVYHGAVFQGLGYGPGELSLSLPNLAANGVHYLLILMVLYPGLLLGPLVSTAPVRRPVSWVTILALVLASLSIFRPRGMDWLSTLVVGSRYLLPAIALLCVDYPWLLRSVFTRSAVRRAVACGLVLTGAVAAVAMSAKHQSYLRQQLLFAEAALASIPADAMVFTDPSAEELLGTPLGTRNYEPLPKSEDPPQAWRSALSKVRDNVAGTPIFLISKDEGIDSKSDTRYFSRWLETTPLNCVTYGRRQLSIFRVTGIQPEALKRVVR